LTTKASRASHRLHEARYWTTHARVEKVSSLSSCIRDGMECLFDAENLKRHSSTWLWIYDDEEYCPKSMNTARLGRPEAVPLYSSSSLSVLARSSLSSCSRTEKRTDTVFMDVRGIEYTLHAYKSSHSACTARRSSCLFFGRTTVIYTRRRVYCISRIRIIRNKHVVTTLQCDGPPKVLGPEVSCQHAPQRSHRHR